MTPAIVRRLEIWASMRGFRCLTVRDAAEHLQELVPGFPGLGDGPTKVSPDGCRWFDHEMEAVADAIYQAVSCSSDLEETLESDDWDVDRDSSGRWSVPRICRREWPVKRPLLPLSRQGWFLR